MNEEDKAFINLLFDLPRRSSNNWFRLAASLNPIDWASIIASGKAPWQGNDKPKDQFSK
jgi:hypothetical protein